MPRRSQTLPIIDPFAQPYEKYSYRNATYSEMLDSLEKTGKAMTSVKESQGYVTSNALEAAIYMLQTQADPGIDDHVDAQIRSSPAFGTWENAMQRRQHWPALDQYKNAYPLDDYRHVDEEIAAIDCVLASGHYFFHGGSWPIDTMQFTTDRPLSTSFSPQPALRNFDHRGKAYASQVIQLWGIRVIEPRSRMYFYDLDDRDALGHEMEVLFASGAHLELRNRQPVPGTYSVTQTFGQPPQYRPMEILEVDLA
ncbi:hypothetical protein [Burkholderia sp. Se-20378]|uniref:hypothetical protein n=1 Tax=Burkholderia sp. Se-20378 TaxID=2703899 RepID=UPI0019807893|nr:hypothetical protein [Burkholderia sp. Se-20378]MBN3771286.1 hypothetical protein [Burkholderia sp. Se-20378]